MIILPIKSKIAAVSSRVFCVFCVDLSLHLPSEGFTDDYKFCISVNKYQ